MPYAWLRLIGDVTAVSHRGEECHTGLPSGTHLLLCSFLFFRGQSWAEIVFSGQASQAFGR